MTGHRYRIHWEAGLDFDSMRMEVSEIWDTADKDVRLVFNHTEQREAINITTKYGSGVQIENNTLSTLTSFSSGDYQMRNATEIREFEILINGKDTERSKLDIKPLECILGACKLDTIEESDLPTSSKPWSDAASWKDGVVPVEGQDVTIDTDMWIELDLAETPRLGKLEINGRLSIKDDKTNLPKVNLKAHLIWIRAGELLAGSSTAPYEADLTIEMLGHTESETLTLGGTVKAGNKVLASCNRVELYGKKRFRMTRMLAETDAGADTITVDATDSTFDWAVGDYIFIATSTINVTHSEYRTITAIDGGSITLDNPLAYYHYGAAESTATKYNGVDIRNEVLLLSRNVKVKGEEQDAWPGHIMATDLIDGEKIREGYIIADNVEFSNLSQKDVGKGGIRWEGAVGSSSTVSTLTNSAFYSGQDWGLSIKSSNNVEVKDNVFVGWRAIGVRIDFTRNVTFSGNFVGDVRHRGIAFTGMTIDKEACVTVGGYEESNNNHGFVGQNNIAAGCQYAGFVLPAYEECGGTNNVSGNVAHSSSRYGLYAYKTFIH